MNAERKEYEINSKQIKVLLVAPVYPAGYRLALPPYNIAYLAGYLRNNPHVILETINAEEHTIEELDELIASAKYDVFGTGGMITTYSFCKHLLDVSQKYRPEAKRVVGGAITAASLEILFEHLPIDCTVLGEGEKTFSELLDVWRIGGDIGVVKGLAYKPDGESIVRTLPRPRINLEEEDLMPDWQIIDIEKYVKWNPLRMYLDYDDPSKMRQFSVFVSRGCPCRCHFCGSPLGRFQKRKIDNIIKEVVYLKEKYDINVIYFMSDIFFASKRDVKDFCEKILDYRLGIRWICNLRVDAANAETFKIMKKAGCDHITFGLESGTDTILEKMNKKTTVLQNRKSMVLAREAGIYPGGAVMFGYLDERLEDIQKTVDMMIEGNYLPSSVSVTTAMPGTVLYDQAVSRGLIEDHYKYIFKLEGDIGVENEPVLNLSSIPDEIFWERMVTEKRRLYTAHYLKNRAVFLGKHRRKNQTFLILKCPHCGSLHHYRISGRTVQLGEQYMCRECHQLIWIDPYGLPENREHYQQVVEFITRANKEKASLAFYSTSQSARNVFLIDIFGIDFRRVVGVIQDSQDVDLIDRKIYGIRICRLSELEDLGPKCVLITDVGNPRSIYSYLLRQSFRKDHLEILLPIPSALSEMRYQARQMFYANLKTPVRILKRKVLKYSPLGKS